MNHRAWLIVSFFVLPVLARQASDKPSPVPDKSRRSSPHTRPAEKSNSSPVGRAQSGAAAESNQIPRGGERSEQTGEACFFTSKVNGTPTASGRPLNSEELVAAHASFPFGSRVRITNLANGRTVEVTIIDRMPASAPHYQCQRSRGQATRLPKGRRRPGPPGPAQGGQRSSRSQVKNAPR